VLQQAQGPEQVLAGVGPEVAAAGRVVLQRVPVPVSEPSFSPYKPVGRSM